MTAEWQALVAPCIVSPLIVAYASYRAVDLGPIKQTRISSSGRVIDPKDEEEEEDTGMVNVTVLGACGFVVVASIFLVILFFLIKYIWYILMAMYGFAGIFSTYNLFMPYVDAIFGPPPKCSINIPCIGHLSIFNMILFVFCLGLVGAWLGTSQWTDGGWKWEGNWILQDIISLSQCVLIISVYNVPNLKISTILLILAAGFDVFWVFISPYIFKKSVMVEVATGNGGKALPMLLVFGNYDGAPILGLGDIVLPGLFIAFMLKYDFFKSNSAQNGYFYVQMAAYSCGVICAYIGASLSKHGQPALMYIVPMCLIAGLVQGLLRGEISQLWNGPPAVVKLLDDEEQIMPREGEDAE